MYIKIRTFVFIYVYIHIHICIYRVITSNTAIVALAVKTFYDKSTSSAQKQEEERAKVRPAVQALKEILRTALPYIPPTPNPPYIGPSQDRANKQEVKEEGVNFIKNKPPLSREPSQEIQGGVLEEIKESSDQPHIKGGDDQGSSLRKKQKLSN
jgi:hypothetical protein